MMKFPRWLSWVVLIGLGWILFVGNTHNRQVPAPAAPTETAATPAPTQYKEIQTLIDGERWKKALYPDYKNPNEACLGTPPAEGKMGNYALVLRDGAGEEAKCGESIQFTIARRNADGSAGKPSDHTLVLGKHKNLDMLLVGMRPDEQRLLIVNLPQAVKSFPANTQLLLEVTRVAAPAVAN